MKREDWSLACRTRGESRKPLACPKRSDNGERHEKKSGCKNAGRLSRSIFPFSRVFFSRCSSRRYPILRSFPHYLNAWDRLASHSLTGCRPTLSSHEKNLWHLGHFHNGDGDEIVPKQYVLIVNTMALHKCYTFWYICFPFSAEKQRKMTIQSFVDKWR